MVEERILDVLGSNTALTGKELRDATGLEEIALWRACRSSHRITSRIIGRRYLRFDRNVQGYARLSPSIKREFLTYTVCGLSDNSDAVDRAAVSLEKEIKNISRRKYRFALSLVERIVEQSQHHQTLLDSSAFLIGGDIVFDMAHLEPRPEKSLGKMVRGSDMDIVVIHEDDCPETVVKDLDRDIHQEKYLCLVKPECREEVDYVIKDLSKTKKQLLFDCFESMIASKILWEAKLLFGKKALFETVKLWLDKNDIPKKVKNMEAQAKKNRAEAEQILLESKEDLTRDDCLRLFFTSEESEEIY